LTGQHERASALGAEPARLLRSVFGVGVDVLRRSLVITDGAAAFGGGRVSAQWFEKNGTPLTGEFVLLTGWSRGET
jgi:hypothetical protein